MQQWVKFNEIKVGDVLVATIMPDKPQFTFPEPVVVRTIRTEVRTGHICYTFVNDRGIFAGPKKKILVERTPVVETAKDVWNRLESPNYVPPAKQVALRPTAVVVQPRSADGLKYTQCLERYLDNMREAVNPDGTPRRWKLTTAQKELAQAMWKQQLADKQTEQAAADAASAITVLMQADDE